MNQSDGTLKSFPAIGCHVENLDDRALVENGPAPMMPAAGVNK